MRSAAFWAAIAALFSALCSIVLVFIHRKNMLEAARPELVPDGWRREPVTWNDGGQLDTITFSKIRNVGRGVALHVVVGSSEPLSNPAQPFAIVESVRVPVIGPGESAKVEGNIRLFWVNASANDGPRLMTIKLQINCWWQYSDACCRSGRDLPVANNQPGQMAAYGSTAGPKNARQGSQRRWTN